MVGEEYDGDALVFLDVESWMWSDKWAVLWKERDLKMFWKEKAWQSLGERDTVLLERTSGGKLKRERERERWSKFYTESKVREGGGLLFGCGKLNAVRRKEGQDLWERWDKFYRKVNLQSLRKSVYCEFTSRWIWANGLLTSWVMYLQWYLYEQVSSSFLPFHPMHRMVSATVCMGEGVGETEMTNAALIIGGCWWWTAARHCSSQCFWNGFGEREH